MIPSDLCLLLLWLVLGLEIKEKNAENAKAVGHPPGPPCMPRYLALLLWEEKTIPWAAALQR